MYELAPPNSNMKRVQRVMLTRSIYVLFAPVMLVMAILACGTVVTDRKSVV